MKLRLEDALQHMVSAVCSPRVTKTWKGLRYVFHINGRDRGEFSGLFGIAGDQNEGGVVSGFDEGMR